MIRILQICNVGEILGGTAACAWTITRALPDFDHQVVFLGDISKRTKSAFSHCGTKRWNQVTPNQIRNTSADILIFHNTSKSRLKAPIADTVSIQYVHSRIPSSPAHLTVYCSNWLAKSFGRTSKDVLCQAVPKPIPEFESIPRRSQRAFPIIGRLCTPHPRKWPPGLPEFYRNLANRFPEVSWEFVGCPENLKPVLTQSCRGRIVFHDASWSARSKFWHWDALLYHNPHVTESFGRTTAEAMRAGCIPIVDSRGGFLEQIDHDRGFLCEKPEDFALAVEELLISNHRQRLSSACQEYADQHFSLARFREDLLLRFEEAYSVMMSCTVPPLGIMGSTCSW
jgi:glycosyltransferase involved in cell wall biosynthesis